MSKVEYKRDPGRAMMSAFAHCPSEKSHPEKMAWIAEYFLGEVIGTQIAANKATEEGELPEGMVIAPHYRGYARLGIGAYVINHTADKPAELIISMATDQEKAGRVVGDNRENPAGHMLQPEAMAVRLCFENVAGLNALEYQLAVLRDVHFPETIKADRASRQVDIKAEVETIDTPEFRELLAAFKNSSLGSDYNETVENLVAHINGRFATPLATTGASTVLTDERIIEVAESFDLLSIRDGGRVDRSALLDFAREVAAQAGQVAVPGWISVDERLPSVPVNNDRQFIIACRRANGKTYVFAASYLNALELDSNDDGESVFTGWHTEGEHAEYSSWYEPVCQAGDNVTHWQELPAAPSPAKESK